MRILLIHQNFPGQFRQLVPHLLQRGHELVAICSHDRPLPEGERLRVLRYHEPPAGQPPLPFSSAVWHEALQRAEAVGGLCLQLRREGWQPDRICAHSGWGETLPLRQIWPAVPQLIWPELWLRPDQMGAGTHSFIQVVPEQLELAQLGRNSLTRVALSMADQWVLPTRFQADSLPAEFRDRRLQVVHEGIDAKQLARPNPEVSFAVAGQQIDRSVPTLTFVNRNLERLRGFPTLMRALPLLQRAHPGLRTLIVGDNEGGYGGGHPSGKPWRQVMLEELEGQLDLGRIHFLGRIPHPQLIALLQASAVHVYLSHPYVLGWSLLEAMACGCCIVGSQGMPVAEVISHGHDGLLVPINDPGQLADQVLQLLQQPQRRQALGRAARQTALLYDQRLTLPAIAALIEASTSRMEKELLEVGT